MISLKDFNEATSQKRRGMASRLKEKRFLSGPRAGKVRLPKRELPFTLAEFRAWTMDRVGMGTVRCFYCPRAIDVLSFEPDHYMPLELGGGSGLDNLRECCEDCNRLKGAMPPEDFIALMQFLETRCSHLGRADLTKRLRAGAMGIKNRFFPDQKKGGAKTPKTQLPTTEQIEF